MIAHVTNLKPGEFIHILGDAHVYESHVDKLKEQIIRKPFVFPKLKIKNKIDDIDNFTIDDFELIDYKCHPKIELNLII
jgi:thymidylate synthase